jgi:hypothetical protein
MEELKRRNRQPQEPTPIVIQSEMPEELEIRLTAFLDGMKENVPTQTNLLREMKRTSPTKEQMEKMQDTLTEIRDLLQLAGKQSVERSWLQIDLPRPRLSWLWRTLAVLAALLLLRVSWCAWVTLWNAVSRLFP